MGSELSLSPGAKAQPSRLAFIEGLRGIAASLVMGEHAMGNIPIIKQLNENIGEFWHATLLQRLTWPILFGEQMVALFIFISGFTLYYSETMRRQKGARTSLREYIRRRSWRILPTYYSALAFSIILILFLPLMRVHTHSAADNLTPITFGGILSHILLVHNLSHEWIFQINGPLWSIATEAQLYIIFPALLAAMLRFNPLVAVIVAALVQNLIGRHVPFPFFALLPFFAGGMLAAHFAVNSRKSHRTLYLVCMCAGLGIMVFSGPSEHYTYAWLIGFAGLTLWLYDAPIAWWNIPTLPATRWLGKISYSLYSIHYPLLYLLFISTCNANWPLPLQIGYMVCMGSVVSVAAAFALYYFVERWSLARIHTPKISLPLESSAA